MRNIKLLPCPFCGSEMNIEVFHKDFQKLITLDGRINAVPCNFDVYEICCSNDDGCLLNRDNFDGFYVRDERFDDFVKQFNTRIS